LVAAPWLGCAPAQPPEAVVDHRVPERAAGWALVEEPESKGWGRGEPPSQPVRPPSDHGQCIRGRMCQLEGFCSVGEGGQCIAASDDDCAPSDACLGGRCSAREGLCVAADDDDCRESWACKGYGLCHHDGDQACMARAEDDCRASTRCARLGECRLDQGACVR
jgi:hypothetical protein